MANIKKKILLVDDEPFLLEALNEYLDQKDGDRYTVLTAKNGREALEVLACENISLVVSDIYMPEISGIHLLTRIKEKYPNTAVILMTAYYSEQIRMKAERGGCLHFIEKPFEFAQIRELINESFIKEDDGFVGTLRNIQLTDLIQMCCLSPITMAIRVTKDSQEGMIYIQEGEIIHASFGNIKGEEAFYTIMGWGTGSFETFDSTIIPYVNIEKSWQSLLMEAVRRIDEKKSEDISLQDEEDNNENNSLESDNARHADVSQIRQISILIVEDSIMMFKVLEKMLAEDKEIRVIGRAGNGAEALEKINEFHPDLITLDVNMPVMDGGTALKHIMLKNPCPVIIISSMGGDSQRNILDFLRLGAIDFVAKPSKVLNMEGYQKYLIDMVKLVSKAKIENFKRVKNHKVLTDKKISEIEDFSCEHLVVIKSGYGGYAEIMRIIPELPNMLNASVLVFQKAPSELINMLSDYLNKRSKLHVYSTIHGKYGEMEKKLKGGMCHIFSDNDAVSIAKKSTFHFLKANEEKNVEMLPKGYHFDQCLQSIAKNFSGKIHVILLSGAELESLDGIKKIKEKGGSIIAQAPESSMVPFSLQKMIAHGIVDIEADPYKIAEIILSNSS